MSLYQSLGDIILDCTNIFEPPERLSVTDASVKYVKLHNPPAYIGPYAPDTTPYMSEPMDTYASRTQKGLVFVGGAQSAKTQGLVLNTLAYTVKCNPMDVILYNPSQAAARDFSKRRVDRLHRYSIEVGAELLPGQHSDNTFDKFYKSGMMFTLSWPSVNEMSGKPVPVTMLTDYDRMPMDVDGEGSPYDLAQKRTTTFKSLGMTVAESSPSKDVTDARWKPATPHEAPPCEGILALYNRGDRRRWHWPCPHCGEFFEGSFSDLKWDSDADPQKSATTVFMMCPKNKCVIRPESRYTMNLRGVWLKEGEKINKHGARSGTPLVSEIASFWLKGVAAAFITWHDLVLKYLNAEREYANTGTQDALKVTVNTDQAEPYLPRGQETNRLAEDLQSFAQPLPEKKVPTSVRALIANIDTQKNMWVVQIHGIAPGNPFNIVVIDRFNIVKSNRKDEDGERLWVKPAEYVEDWDLLVTEVIERRYDLEDGSGTMGVAFTTCDSGGREGVTNNAYLFYGRLKAKGKADRFLLTKGDPLPNCPRVHISFPDSKRKDRMAKARGEVPVMMLNVNMLKDMLNGMLPYTDDKGVEINPDRIVFPDWLDSSFYEELTAEIRTVKGWENKHGRRNESWDDLTYCLGVCVHRKIEHVSWENPPSWLQSWDKNPHVVLNAKDGAIASPQRASYGLAQLGEALG